VRRHQAVVWSGALCTLLSVAVIGAGLGWVVRDRAARRAETERVMTEGLNNVQQLQDQARWPEALAAAQQVEELLAGRSIPEDLGERLRDRLADLKMVARLEEARLQTAAATSPKACALDIEGAEDAYGKAFREYGLDVDGLGPAEAANRIQARPICLQLAAALDDWSRMRRTLRGEADPTWKHLLAVAQAADPDPWRGYLRAAWERKDREALLKVAASVQAGELPAPELDLLGWRLWDAGATKEAVALLREGQRRHPADFGINFDLGYCLVHETRPSRCEEAIRFLTAALALRPRSPAIYLILGGALHNNGMYEDAVAAARQAIRLKPDYATAHNNLGIALHYQGKQDEAIAELREAIRLNKDDARAHSNLGDALREKGQLDEAIAECCEAIRLKKDNATAHSNLGLALRNKGQLDQAIAELREAIRIKKDYAEAHNNLGVALHDRGQLEEAIAEYREATGLKKDYAEAHYNLGKALHEKGELDEAIAQYREAIRLKKEFSEAHCNLGSLLEQKGEFTEALIYRRRGHELGSKNPRWRYPSAQWVRECERLVELDGKLPAILDGHKQPADVAERLELAQLCVMPCKKRYADAVRLFREAFEEEPKLADDLNAQHRYNAACAAALAGCGQGQDADKLDAQERARLRQQALDWLQADLKVYHQLIEKSAGKAGPTIAQRMQHWLQDTDFAAVRGDESRARLPEAESKQWRKLWEEVEVLWLRATSRPKTASSARP
jgi:tetratricopeptide (TPR) repeat protein